MQDISRVTGNPQKFTIRGEEITIGEASIETLGRIQAEAIKAKRQAVVKAVTDLADVLPLDDYKSTLKEATLEARKITAVTDVEFETWMRTLDGGVTFMHTLLSMQFPEKQYTRAEVVAAVSVAPANLVEQAAGVSAEGEATGPSK